MNTASQEISPAARDNIERAVWFARLAFGATNDGIPIETAPVPEVPSGFTVMP